VLSLRGTPSPSGRNLAGPITWEGQQQALLKGLKQLVGQARRKDVKLVLFFLSDDTRAIGELLAKYQLNCDAVSLPGGLDNPILNTLGIYSQERYANTVVIAPNGEFMMNYSKLHHMPHPVRDRKLRGRYLRSNVEGALDLPWFNPMMADQLTTFIKQMVSNYDVRMGNLYYHKVRAGWHVDLLDPGSCCMQAFDSGWRGCKNACCQEARAKGKVCLVHNPGARGKPIRPAGPADWALAARYFGLTFNDNMHYVKQTSGKYYEALMASKDYKGALEIVNHVIKNHRASHGYGLYRKPIAHHEKRARIYELMGNRGAAAAERNLIAKLKAEDAKKVADYNAGKAKQKAQIAAAKAEKMRKEKAALEALRKKQAEEAKKKAEGEK